MYIYYMKDKILKLRKEGRTYSEIQKALKCSRSTINYHCSSDGKSKVYKRTHVYRSRRKNQIRAFVKRVKSILGCCKCGIKDWRCLDFDHVREKKEFGIAESVAYSFTIKRVKIEMRKCQILCANCHRIKTLTERGL